MTEWIAVISITLFAVISPGPDFAVVSRNALLKSRQVGVLTAFGISTGVLVHVTYTLLGVGLLIRQTPALFEVLKWLGAAYLVWLGVTMVLARKSDGSPILKAPGQVRSDGFFKAFGTGFLTNALNPKTTIFIASLFLQVVNPQTPLPIQVAYGVFISLAHGVWFAVVALFFSSRRIQQRLYAVRHWIDRAFGSVLIGFGVALAAASLGR